MGDASENGTTAEPEFSAWQMLAPVIDLVTPMAVRAAATVRIADFMGAGPVSIADLARRSGCDADALERLLNHLVEHGVFTAPGSGMFALNELAALLRSDHPGGMQVSLDLAGFGGQMDLAFTGILHTLRTGQPAWQTVFGAPFWQYLAANPQMSASFDATMAAGAEYVADDAGGYDWSAAKHVVDVGGGDGALLATVLQAYPDLRATLVDLPDTVERGRERLAACGVDTRCAFAGQSFFDALPPGSDVYVLNSVLHDWNDMDAAAILARCSEAAGGRGRVVIIEDSGEESSDRRGFAEMDLRMLVLCGGRERSLDDYSALVTTASLTVADIRTTPLGQLVIECVPA